MDNVDYVSMNYKREEIEQKVKTAVEILFKKDSDLLDKNVHERSVCHKFAEYLQIQFSDLNVDLEYNRKGESSKILEGLSKCPNYKNERRKVIPDIIVHKRTKKYNLLVIEVKTNNRYLSCDFEKLKKFTSDSVDFKYRFGLSIKFNKIKEPNYKWFKKGIEE